MNKCSIQIFQDPIKEDYPQIHSEIMMTEIQRCMKEGYTPEQAVAAISNQTKALLENKS